MVPRPEAADGADGFRERPGDEVHLVLQPGFVGQTAPVRPQHAEGMGLVHQQLKAVFALDVYELLERRAVAEHRIDALQHHQPPAFLRVVPRQPLGQAVGIVVAEAAQFRARQRAAVIDGGVRIGVQKNRVLRPGQPGDHAQVGLIAGGEDDAVLAPQKARQLLFQLPVHGVCAIGDARAGGAGAVFAQRLAAGLDALLLEGDAHVVVGARQNHLAAIDHGPRRRQDAVVDQPHGVRPHGDGHLVPLHDGAVFFQQVFHRARLFLRFISHARRQRARDRPWCGFPTAH